MADSDEQRVQERRQRMTEILADIAGHAQATARERCPYKSKPGLCTAKFSCRNQQPAAVGGGSFICGHDGAFDYRTAWETRPDAYEITRAKLRRIREEAELRRRSERGTQDPE